MTQIPNDYPDAEIAKLGTIGVRAVRFNILRGLIDNIDEIVTLATRCHAIAGWHCEIYTDAAALKPHVDRLSKLPQIAIDHLGMTEAGVPVLLDLVAAGCKVKTTGFGRTKVDIPKTLEIIAQRNPSALVFGTDLPSTRAQRPFLASDIDLIENVLGPELARRTFWDNPLALYKVKAWERSTRTCRKAQIAMVANGPKQTCGPRRSMSAKRREADSESTPCFGPLMTPCGHR